MKIISQLSLLSLVIASGCASMKNGKEQTVEFDALPAGTTVRVQPGSDQPLRTPAAVLLDRKNTYKAYFEKTGYETQTVELNSKSTGGAARNLVFLNPAIIASAVVVDGYTGANRAFTNKVFVILKPLRVDPVKAE